MGEHNWESGGYQSIEERWALSEVHHINRLRNLDGSHNPANLDAIRVSLRTHVQEAVMPFAVSVTEQEYRNDRFWWMDQTSEDVARSGYDFHQAEAALARVDVEVEEARQVEESLRPGFAKIIVSPRMSEYDAPVEIAKQEHLADDDQIRIQMLNFDQFGNIAGKTIESLLVRDVPLAAWVAMLRDPDNIFGRSIEIDDDRSALSVLSTHSQLNVEENLLPKGVISVIEAVLPYIEDDETQQVVEAQVQQFNANQAELNEIAEEIAGRWIGFEAELADSLFVGYATQDIVGFIGSLEKQWHDKFLSLLQDHLDINRGKIVMTEELAAQLELARRNTLWVSAGVSSKNEYVLSRLNSSVTSKLAANAATIQALKHSPGHEAEIARLYSENDRIIAYQNIPVGRRGCSGLAAGSFGSELEPGSEIFRQNQQANGKAENANEDSPWEYKKGVCVVKSCKSGGKTTMVGPCGVCRSCQHMFDQGQDPTKLPDFVPTHEEANEPTNVISLIGRLANRQEAIDKHKLVA